MLNETDLNNLVSNVLSENRYKHCRLCLKEIQDDCMKFDDCASIDDYQNFLTLGQILDVLLGDKICEEIMGIDAVCSACVEMAIECKKFIDSCKNSTNKLHKIFDNLINSLNIDTETVSRSQKLYVVIQEDDSKVILMDNSKSMKEDITCNSCDETFESTEQLQAHKTVGHPAISKCNICQETFLNQEEFQEHSKMGHAFKCPDCNQQRSTEDRLSQHIDKAHTVYVCKECGKSCNGLDKLQSHEEKHDTKSNCPKCGKTYLTKCFYYKHVVLCAAGKIDPHPYRAKTEKNYLCQMCSKGYSTPGGLRVHERFEHGDAKYHMCQVCGKKFTAPSGLKSHMIRHTGEKKFKCTLCAKNFVSRDALLHHTRRHTGDKPYSCDICHERFVNASGRAGHIKYKHTSPKLKCDICNSKFFTPSFLRQHTKRHEDPSSTLYVGRNLTSPDMPGGNNMRTKINDEDNMRTKVNGDYYY